MSNEVVGKLYASVIDGVVDDSRADFEDNGVDEVTLQELRTLWQNKLTRLAVAPRMPWDPLPLADAVKEDVYEAAGGKFLQTTAADTSGLMTPGNVAANISGPGANATTTATPQGGAYVKKETDYMPGSLQVNPGTAAFRAAQNIQQFAQENQDTLLAGVDETVRGIMYKGGVDVGANTNANTNANGTSKVENGAPTGTIASTVGSTAVPTGSSINSGSMGGSIASTTATTGPATNGNGNGNGNGSSEGGLVLPGGGHLSQMDGSNDWGDEITLSREQIDALIKQRAATRLQNQHENNEATIELEIPRRLLQNDGPGEDEGAINSDLDDSEDEANFGEEEDDDDQGMIMLCLYDKVQRVKNKWKYVLKDGVANVNGKDYVFSKASGESEW